MNLINIHHISIIVIINLILILIIFNYKILSYHYNQNLILLIAIICLSILIYIRILLETRLGIILNVDIYYINKNLYKEFYNTYFKCIDWNFSIKELNKDILNNKDNYIANKLFMDTEKYKKIQNINNMTEEEKINYIRKLWWDTFLLDNIYYIGIGTIITGFIYFIVKNT